MKYLIFLTNELFTLSFCAVSVVLCSLSEPPGTACTGIRGDLSLTNVSSRTRGSLCSDLRDSNLATLSIPGVSQCGCPSSLRKFFSLMFPDYNGLYSPYHRRWRSQLRWRGQLRRLRAQLRWRRAQLRRWRGQAVESSAPVESSAQAMENSAQVVESSAKVESSAQVESSGCGELSSGESSGGGELRSWRDQVVEISSQVESSAQDERSVYTVESSAQVESLTQMES